MKRTLIALSVFIALAIIPSVAQKKKHIEFKDANEPKITFKIWFKVGSQDDPKGKEGLAYITGRMLSEGGTAQSPYDAILEKLFPMATDYSANVSTEMTIFGGSVHKDNLNAYVKLLTEQLLSPGFREEDFQRIKQDAVTYLSTTLKYSSDEELGKAVLYNNLFKGLPYAHPLQGTLAGLESINLDDVKAFYTQYFNRNNFQIGIAGNYENQLLIQLNDELKKLPEGAENKPAAFSVQQPDGRTVTIVEKQAAATAISIGYHLPVLRGEKDFYALSIVNSWLGEHRNSSSHLYQVIREKRGLNYGDYSYIEYFPNGGRYQLPNPNVARRHQLFEIWIRPVPNETRLFALRAALREYDKLVDNGMTKEDFETTRKFLKDYVLHYATTLSKKLGYAIDDRFYNIEGSHLEIFRKMMETLTLEDVNAAIKRYFSKERLSIVFITSDAQKLKEDLLNEAASPITYSSPKSADILAEDKLISVYPVKINPSAIEVINLEDLFNK